MMYTFATHLILVSVAVVALSRSVEPQTTSAVKTSSSSLAAIHHEVSETRDLIPQRTRRQPLPYRAARYFAIFLALIGSVLLLLGIFGVFFDAPETHASHATYIGSWSASYSTPLIDVEPVEVARSSHNLFLVSGISMVSLGFGLYAIACACLRPRGAAGNFPIGAPQHFELPMRNPQLVDPALFEHYEPLPPFYGSAEMANSARLPPPPPYEPIGNVEGVGAVTEVAMSVQGGSSQLEETNTEGVSTARPSSPHQLTYDDASSTSTPGPSLQRESSEESVNPMEESPS